MVKSTVCARSGVIDMPPMMTSNLPARRAGMIPLQAVGWKSTLTPMSSATFFATSISKPMRSPLLERMAQGTKVALPTTNVPRFLITSITLSCACDVPAAKMPTRSMGRSLAIVKRFTWLSLSRRSPAAPAESPLDHADGDRQRYRQSEIHRRYRKPDLEGHKRVGDDILAFGGQVGNGDHSEN